jgi:putative ABC transport system substrate-binding protein
MERRAFILATISGGLLTAPLAAQAQQAGKVYRLGILSPTAPPAPSDRAVTSLLVPAVLREMGYVEGQNLVVERRYADNQFARLPDLARQLVELRMDVILAVGNDAPGAARDVSTTIPIVMLGRDPVKLGYVASLARPGGNITGVVISETGLADKRLELLRERFQRRRGSRFSPPATLASRARSRRRKEPQHPSASHCWSSMSETGTMKARSPRLRQTAQTRFLYLLVRF